MSSSNSNPNHQQSRVDYHVPGGGFVAYEHRARENPQQPHRVTIHSPCGRQVSEADSGQSGSTAFTNARKQLKSHVGNCKEEQCDHLKDDLGWVDHGDQARGILRNAYPGHFTQASSSTPSQELLEVARSIRPPEPPALQPNISHGPYHLSSGLSVHYEACEVNEGYQHHLRITWPCGAQAADSITLISANIVVKNAFVNLGKSMHVTSTTAGCINPNCQAIKSNLAYHQKMIKRTLVEKYREVHFGFAKSIWND